MGTIIKNGIAYGASLDAMLKTDYAPDATAIIAGGVLTVTSVYAHPTGNYSALFNMPAGYTPADTLVLDGDAVQVVGMDGSPMTLDAAEGAPVELVRRGNLVFPKMGGGNNVTDGLLFIDDTERQVGWYMTGTNTGGERLYKPWYEKSFDISSAFSGGVSTIALSTYGIINNENTALLRAYAVRAGGLKHLLPFIYSDSNYSIYVGELSAGETLQSFTIGSSSGVTKISFTYRYTKTTDTAKTKAEILAT